MNKQVVYTCITGGYDNLREPKFVSSSIDYICFTDNAALTSKFWKIKQIPSELNNLSDVKKQRLIKILPHKYLSEYDTSLWIDSNITIVGDVKDFFNKYDLSQKFLYTNKHPGRDCLYREQLAVIRLKKDTYENTNPQIDRYREEGFPEHYGLAETNILLRAHKNPRCIKLMNAWGEEILRGSHRDQLSFNYCVWKCGVKESIEYLSEKYYNLHLADNSFFALENHIKMGSFRPFVDTREEENRRIAEELRNKQLEEEEERKRIEAEEEQKRLKEEEIAKILEKDKEEERKNRDLPIVPVVIFTHNRTNVAIETIRYLVKNIVYPKLRWIISDDRSENGHVEKLISFFGSLGIVPTVCRTNSTRWGLGASMNNGLKEAFRISDFVLRCEDDWILEKKLDLVQHIRTMMANKEVVAIRLAMVAGGVKVNERKKIPGYKVLCGDYGSNSWIFNNQVCLVRKTIHDRIGWYTENTTADKEESEFKDRFNKRSDWGKKDFIVLSPSEMKWNTLDDPSLWFIHVGRSTLGHTIYKEPKRYSWIYSSRPKEIVKAKVEKKMLEDFLVKKLVTKNINSNTTKEKEEQKNTVQPVTLDKNNNNDVVVSIASYKNRLISNSLLETLKSILRQKTSYKIHVCVTIPKSDESYIKPELSKFINDNGIEIIFCEEDLKSHNKYYYAMQKYRNVPIILIDDDLVYDSNLVDLLMNNYKKYPSKISARRVHKISIDKYGRVLPYLHWKKEYDCDDSYNESDLFVTSGGGTLFPPDILKISEKDKFVIDKFKTSDDMFFKYKCIEYGIQISHVKTEKILSYKEQVASRDKSSLCFLNAAGKNYNDEYIDILFGNKEKIIVSMTSWKKRIAAVPKTIRQILNQTIKPDKIIVNLSYDEFKNKEKDLPEELIQMNKFGYVEIFWVKENTKPYKKIVPTLKRFPKDAIISVDDDIDYPPNFIEELYDTYLKYGKQCPITSGTNKWDNDIFSYYGCFSLIKKDFLGNYFDDLYTNLYLKHPNDFPFCDPMVTYSLLLNGKRIKFTQNLNMSLIRARSHSNSDALSRLGTLEYKKKRNVEHELIRKYIETKYKKSYDSLFDGKIIVNLTTYPKRDKYLYRCLKHFKNQTLKPHKIVLYLCEKEYNKYNLPQNILKCVNEKLVSEIFWVKNNTYCHKRFEGLEKYYGCYNFVIDDDILYDKNYLKDLYSNAKKHQSSVTIFQTNEIDYSNFSIVKMPLRHSISYKNAFCGGLNCFPPYTLPIAEFFNPTLLELRDKYVTKCDEAWIRAFLLKYDITIQALHPWKELPTMEDSQKTALYNENKAVKDGMREKERNFFNAIKILNVDRIAKRIWPHLDIEHYKIH